MLFSSYTFILFFVFVFIVSRAIKNWRKRKFFLLVMSYVFYAGWNPPFVMLLWISTIFDFFIAKRMDAASDPRRRKQLLIVSLLINLGFLGFFKYGTFLLENVVFVTQSVGIPFKPEQPNIILPVGISFYTFVTLSYTIDVYRRNIAAWDSLLDYALFVTFFPHLVAGPIVRARDFLPQMATPRVGTERQIGWGATLLIIGLFYKVVVADTFMSPIVEQVYDQAGTPGFLQAWAGTLAFAIQIFCDFAGYSLCAIGTALCLGFIFPDNFRFPYASVGFSDFWRRWHISLSTWLRDYLYIPLGGNRKGKLRTNVNLMVTMLIGGLWHGASWLFVIWGGLHGSFLIIERLIKESRLSTYNFWKKSIVRVGLSLITFGLVCFAWVFFRADTLTQAFDIVSAMMPGGLFSPESEIWLPRIDYITVLVATVFFLGFHWYMRNKSLEELSAQYPWWVRSGALALLIAAITLSFAGDDRAFIYFQF